MIVAFCDSRILREVQEIDELFSVGVTIKVRVRCYFHSISKHKSRSGLSCSRYISCHCSDLSYG